MREQSLHTPVEEARSGRGSERVAHSLAEISIELMDDLPSGSREDTGPSLVADTPERTSVPEVYDWTALSYAEVRESLTELVGKGYLLHGSNPGSEQLHRTLTPYQGHDVRRESGQRYGVYATDNSVAVIPYALMNRKALRQRGFDSFVTSFGVSQVSDKPAAPYIGVDSKAVFDYIVEHPEEIFTAGYIYVLDAEPFVPAADAPDELVAEGEQIPRMIVRIGAQVGRDLFRPDGDNPTLRLMEPARAN
ncbi:MAG: hypothetical protein WD467_01920 [Candidatus Saccharimonadales bacterium]